MNNARRNCFGSIKSAPVIIILYLLTAGCGEDEKREQQLPVLTFEVLDSLLARPTYDTVLGISYAIPRGWKDIPEKVIDDVLGTLGVPKGEEGDFHFQAGYWEQKSGSILIVNRLGRRDSTFAREYFENTRQYYRERSSSSMKAGVFSTGTFTVHQLVVTETSQILLKLIFEPAGNGSNPFEFNFMIPSAEYAGQLKSIESSIGSIQSTIPIH